MNRNQVKQTIEFCQNWQDSIVRFDERNEMHDKQKALSEGAGYA